jgi:hypothetical protein
MRGTGDGSVLRGDSPRKGKAGVVGGKNFSLNKTLTWYVYSSTGQGAGRGVDDGFDKVTGDLLYFNIV